MEGDSVRAVRPGKPFRSGHRERGQQRSCFPGLWEFALLFVSTKVRYFGQFLMNIYDVLFFIFKIYLVFIFH